MRTPTKFLTLTIVLVVVFSSAACKLPMLLQGEKATPISQAEETTRAWFDAPAEGASLPLAPVEIVYHAGEPSAVSQVELSVNGEVKSLDANPDPSAPELTFRYSWQPPAPGSYIFTVRAQGQAGAWSDTARLSVTVVQDDPTRTPEPSATPTAEPTRLPTWTDIPTATVAPTETQPPAPSLTPTPAELTFTPTLSVEKFFYGGCTPGEVEIKVRTSDPSQVFNIVVFFKLEDLVTGEKTAWDDGTSLNPTNKPGEFSRIIASSKIANYSAYVKARVLYQLIATDKNGDVVARSKTYSDLYLSKCGS